MTVEIIGPFESHAVVVNGRQVPFLTATPMNGGLVALHLDHRFAVDLSVQQLNHIVPFIAQCIAVAAGYSGHPDAAEQPFQSRPFAPRLRSSGSAVIGGEQS